MLAPAVLLSHYLSNDISTVVTEAAKGKLFVGGSLAIGREDQIEVAFGIGKTALRSGREVTVDDRFCIGSVSKEFTAACILVLASEGKLSLDDKVSRYLPYIKSSDQFTIRHLLTHTSGLPNYYYLDYVMPEMEKPGDARKIVEECGALPLEFEPGTNYNYSNTGFMVAGLIVEKVSKQPLAKFMKDRIFLPAGMTSTTFEASIMNAKGLVKGYATIGLEPLFVCHGEGRNWLFGAGSLVSTASDIAKWDLALMSGKLLKTAWLKEMTTPYRLKNGKSIGYGLGLVIGSYKGELVWQHAGAVDGYNAQNVMFPNRKLAVVYLTNTGISRAKKTVWAAAGGYLNSTAEPKLSHGGTDLPKVTARGLSPDIAIRILISRLQKGEEVSDLLTPEFDGYLTPQRRARISKYFKTLGGLTSVKITEISGKRGMEDANYTLVFTKKTVSAETYRMPDGKIMELFFTPDN